MKKRKTIDHKIITLFLSLLSAIVLLLIAVSVTTVARIRNYDSALILQAVCEKEAFRYNDEFRMLENSVQASADYLEEQAASASKETICSDAFCDRIRNMAVRTASRTEGAMSVYFRYDPEYSGSGTSGFFETRHSSQDKFSPAELTDIPAFAPDDTEHVGWFYQPKALGAPLWMSPYYNRNLGVFMISYVIPLYTEQHVFLGVLGMDIDFSKIIQLAGISALYRAGKAELIDRSAGMAYHASGNGGTEGAVLSESLEELLDAAGPGVSVFRTRKETDGIRCLSCSCILSNGMYLFLYVPLREINAQQDRLMLICFFITAVMVLITFLLVPHITRRIIQPLQILTTVTSQYAKGKWEETYTCNTGDEIQELAESISVMASTTREYIKQLNARALQDKLTGLKNKNAYIYYIEKYEKAEYRENPVYAVIVLDINFLKKVNDEYGHEKGDQLIIQAGKFICNIYDHSPVFRIGGDEYIVISEGVDYENREALLRKFEEQLRAMPEIAENIPLSISIGMASAPADGTDYNELFKTADQRMYAYKKQMKAGRDDA